MTPQKVMEVMYFYKEFLTGKRSTHDEAAKDKILDMIPNMELMARNPHKTEKLMRWLGFAQGVLWQAGYFTLEQLKSHNRP